MEKIINRAMNFFMEDESGTALKGPFIDLIGFSPRENNKMEASLRNNLIYIHQDLWNLSTIFHRLDWYRQLAVNNERQYLDDWRVFSKLDIDHFHVEFRSIFDYLSECIALISVRPSVIRHKSWQQLFRWLEKNETNKSRLGTDLYLLVRSGSWVLDIITIRDDLVHFGGNSLIYGNPRKEGILFQCYSGKNYKPQIDFSAAMFNENVVKFELYSAIFFSRLLCFLDDFAAIFNATIKPNVAGSFSRSYSPGFRVMNKWLEDLRMATIK